MISRFSKASKPAKELPPPPPPGQLTDPDFEEVSPVGMPANGRLFLVRRGGKLAFEKLSPDQLQQLKDAGLAPPTELSDVVKEAVEAVLKPFFPNLFAKGDEPVTQPATPGATAPTPAAKADDAAEETPPAADTASDETPETPAEEPAAETETAKGLEEGDLQQIREIAKEVAGSIIDERLSALEERLAATETASQEAKDETAEMKKSLEDLQTGFETQKQDVAKALGDFRPGSQLGDHTTPPDPADVAKQESSDFWTTLASAKPNR